MKPEYFKDYKKIKKFEYNIEDIHKFLESGVQVENMQEFINLSKNIDR